MTKTNKVEEARKLLEEDCAKRIQAAWSEIEPILEKYRCQFTAVPGQVHRMPDGALVVSKPLPQLVARE